MSAILALLSLLAFHGQVGAWDEIGLIALGLVFAAVMLAILLRGRRFEPELEDDKSEPKAGDAADQDSPGL